MHYFSSWQQLSNAFCATIENNSFLSFVATDTVISFWVWVTSTTNNLGIQIFVFEAANCGSGSVNAFECWSPGFVPAQPYLYEATGLTIGNQYYIMIDGNSGDVADYEIAAHEGFQTPVNVASVLGDTAICLGESIDLFATGGSGNYIWSPAAMLSATTGDCSIHLTCR